MDIRLQEKCDTLLSNFEALKKGNVFERESLILVGSSLYLSAGKTVDPEKLRKCKSILKKKESWVSSFRGVAEFVIRVKMALSPDPVEYIDNLNAAYDALKSFLSGQKLVTAAMILTDIASPAEYESLAQKSKEIFKTMKKDHPLLTSEDDMSFAVIMAASGTDGSKYVNEAEEIYGYLNKQMRLGKNSVQRLSQILSLYEGDPKEKADRISDIFTALKKAGHGFGNTEYASILGIFGGTSLSANEIVGMMSAAEDYLKDHKPFNKLLGVDRRERKFYAALLTENSILQENRRPLAIGNDAIAASVATTINITIVMNILLLMIISGSVSAATSAH